MQSDESTDATVDTVDLIPRESAQRTKYFTVIRIGCVLEVLILFGLASLILYGILGIGPKPFPYNNVSREERDFIIYMSIYLLICTVVNSIGIASTISAFSDKIQLICTISFVVMQSITLLIAIIPSLFISFGHAEGGGASFSLFVFGRFFFILGPRVIEIVQITLAILRIRLIRDRLQATKQQVLAVELNDNL